MLFGWVEYCRIIIHPQKLQLMMTLSTTETLQINAILPILKYTCSKWVLVVDLRRAQKKTREPNFRLADFLSEKATVSFFSTSFISIKHEIVAFESLPIITKINHEYGMDVKKDKWENKRLLVVYWRINILLASGKREMGCSHKQVKLQGHCRRTRP